MKTKRKHQRITVTIFKLFTLRHLQIACDFYTLKMFRDSGRIETGWNLTNNTTYYY